MMKTLTAALALTCLSTFAHAQSCTVQAGDRKLAGAAKTSFMTRCERDAGATCDKQAAEKKLNGAAKTSFTKKCVSDSVGG